MCGTGRRETNDDYLSGLLQEHSINVALLNEAPVGLLRRWREDDETPTSSRVVFSDRGTVGRDYTRPGYSAAVYAGAGVSVIEDARARSYRGRRPDIDFAEANSRPGSWVAASVPFGARSVSCISLYGLCDELSDASMHRSISEVSPIFSDPSYTELVLLGGDFNTFTGNRAGYADRDRLVLDRIAAYG